MNIYHIKYGKLKWNYKGISKYDQRGMHAQGRHAGVPVNQSCLSGSVGSRDRAARKLVTVFRKMKE